MGSLSFLPLKLIKLLANWQNAYKMTLLVDLNYKHKL